MLTRVHYNFSEKRKLLTGRIILKPWYHRRYFLPSKKCSVRLNRRYKPNIRIRSTTLEMSYIYKNVPHVMHQRLDWGFAKVMRETEPSAPSITRNTKCNRIICKIISKKKKISISKLFLSLFGALGEECERGQR